MQSVQIESQNFNISAYLEQLCKRQRFYDQQDRQKLQIDFLALEKDLTRIQGVQQRTCEQIVEFVDQNRQRFIKINQQLDQIETKVKQSENILKLLNNKIDQYKSEYYLTQSKMQRFINQYQLKLIKNQVLALAKTEAIFLLKFNNQFQSITNSQVQKLNFTQKGLISRFTYKLNYFKSLYNHYIVKQNIPQSLQINEIVNNLGEQLQFYISEQLSRVQQHLSRITEAVNKNKINEILNLIKGWYISIGKKEEYYRVIEKNTIQKQMQSGQKTLISNKTALLSGKEQIIIQNVFTKIFTSISMFPENHPKERLRHIIFSFFKKDELKFIYTYAMPIFPLAYSSYFAAIEKSNLQEWLSNELKEHHGWNLKMWIQVRQKNIFDRSNNDTDILKWIDIVFKSSCMLPGTLPEFTRLVFRIVNRYLTKVQSTDFLSSTFNRLVELSEKAGPMLKQKILQNNLRATQVGNSVQQALEDQFKKTIKRILDKNLHNISSSCQSCLQSSKSFVSKIIKKDKEFVISNTINKREQLFKPLYGFLKNNAELTEKSIQYVNSFVEQTLIKYYDTHYAPQVFNYSKDHLISEQVSLVMEVIGRQRTTIFKNSEQQ